MPSTTSSSVSRLLASSTVMTPSLPTFSMALARKSPISLSPLAEMVPTWAISAFDVTFLEFFLSSSTTCSTAMSMPRLRSIGFMPAATDLEPSLTIAWARTVAVVVPSPAKSEDFEATSRTICAPMFSNLSSSSISFATVTPSLVMRGAPNDFSSTTLRPLGPSVTLTALARMSTPCSMRSRASWANFTSLACIVFYSVGQVAGLSGFLLRGDVLEHAENVAFLHKEKLFPVDRNFGAGPLAEQHAIARFYIEGLDISLLVRSAGAYGDDFALLRLLLGGIRNDNAALGPLVLLDPAYDDAVMQWTKLHLSPPAISDVIGAPARCGYVDGQFSTFKTRVLSPLAIIPACCQRSDLV